LLLTTLALASVPSYGRHVQQAPEELLEVPLALDSLVKWVSRCYPNSSVPDVGVEPSWRVLEWVRDLRRVTLEGGSTPLPLVLGGAQLKALKVVLEGRGTVLDTDVRLALEASAKALTSLGIPVALVEEALSGSSYRDVLALALSLDPGRGGLCVKELQARVVLFSLHLERGDYSRAGKLAEEVLSSTSVFFGLAMLRLVEVPTVYIAAQQPQLGADVPQELVEELVEKLRELNVDLQEVLSRYSLLELVELYEELKSYSPEVVLAALKYGNLTLTPTSGGLRDVVEGFDEDLVRPGWYYGQGLPLGNSTTSPAQTTSAEHVDLSIALSRLPSKLISRAAEVASSVSLAYYTLSSARGSEEVLRRSEARALESHLALQVAIATAVVVALVPAVVAALRRGSSLGPPRRWVPSPLAHLPVAYRNKVVELFWRAVDVVGRRVEVRVEPADTHREIVSKLSSKLGSVEAGALRELGRLYELARFSATPLKPEDFGRADELARRLRLESLGGG